jgi:glycine/D-amino acid oxidase-like deaminating enzyme
VEVERVVVVGGGVLGMMHALEARRRGHEVVHLEREPVPRGASVRNFGLIWGSGRAPGLVQLLEVQDARLDVGQRAAVGQRGRVDGGEGAAGLGTDVAVAALVELAVLPPLDPPEDELLQPAASTTLLTAAAAMNSFLWARAYSPPNRETTGGLRPRGS